MKREQIFENYSGIKISGLLAALLIVFTVSILFPFCQSKSSDNKTEKPTELDGLKVPAGFSIERVVSPDMITYPMFASFDGNGRLFVFESNGSSPSTEDMLKKPPYHIRLLEDTNGDGTFDKNKIFADSLTFPKGGVFYKGSLYVTASPDLLKLTDTDGNGVADKREVILTGWVFNHNGALLGGPFLGPDGWMYLTDARRGFDITTKEGVPLKGNSARIWRCHPDGSNLESMSGGGYDNAIELIFMPSGETIGTMTYFIEPQAGMRDALMHWVEGGVYPKPYPVIEQDHFKLTGDLMPVMTKTARVAPSGLLRYRGSGLGEEYDGNLFSAEFNTGRIMRHKILPDGGTFRTVDEPFITSTVSDIHLTDVLQDADGSLLVVNTGGWFITGCPLSRVAKLDVHGGIYRIRKNGADQSADPWGIGLNIESLSGDSLIEYAKDPRNSVRDKVMERLVQLGPHAVSLIRNSLMKSDQEETRAAGVFALYRISTPDAFKEVRAALGDSSAMVRTAAARALGLAKNTEAVDPLMDLVQKDKPSVRRQAATALGQIGDRRATQALLNAAVDSSDRFVEHAIIYALIQLKNIPPLKIALTNSSWHARKVAIIALDQMNGKPLNKENVIPFLASNNTPLRNTGIWVASHYTNWGNIVVDFLQDHFRKGDLAKDEVAAIRDLMITFSQDKQLQNFITTQLGNTSVSNERKALFIEVINHSTVKEIPGSWVQQLGKLLSKGDVAIRSLVLGLIESRGINALNDQLKSIIQNPKNTGEFRLKALSSRMITDPGLSNQEFRMALEYLDKKIESPVRQLAARVLAPAKLNDTQLIQLAKEEVARTDVFLLPNLVNAFDGNNNPAVGEALVSALSSSSNRLDNLSEQDLQRLFRDFPASVKTSAEPLMKTLRERNADRLSQLQAVDAKLKKGDVGQGRQLFFSKALCSTCHAVGGQGGDFAPDLSNIGQIRSKHDILEAILYPSASFAREHETSKVITKTITYTGIIKEQLPGAIVLATGPGQLMRIQRNDINSIQPHDISMMPPGLDKQLTTEELSDLIAYLTSLPDGMGGHGNEH